MNWVVGAVKIKIKMDCQVCFIEDKTLSAGVYLGLCQEGLVFFHWNENIFLWCNSGWVHRNHENSGNKSEVKKSKVWKKIPDFWFTSKIEKYLVRSIFISKCATFDVQFMILLNTV